MKVLCSLLRPQWNHIITVSKPFQLIITWQGCLLFLFSFMNHIKPLTFKKINVMCRDLLWNLTDRIRSSKNLNASFMNTNSFSCARCLLQCLRWAHYLHESFSHWNSGECPESDVFSLEEIVWVRGGSLSRDFVVLCWKETPTRLLCSHVLNWTLPGHCIRELVGDVHDLDISHTAPLGII